MIFYLSIKFFEQEFNELINAKFLVKVEKKKIKNFLKYPYLNIGKLIKKSKKEIPDSYSEIKINIIKCI